MAPIISDEMTGKILAETKGKPGQAKIFEDRDEKFVTYKGVRIPQSFKIKASISWFACNRRMGVNPYVLCIKKTGWSFLATCIADALFASEELGGKERFSGRIFVFDLPEPMTMSFIQRKIIRWRNKKDIVAESTNIFAFREGKTINVRVSYINDFMLSKLQNFKYDRKKGYWTGDDEQGIKALAILDNLPDTKTYGRGLYYLCEMEERKVTDVTDLDLCFQSLFSL